MQTLVSSGLLVCLPTNSRMDALTTIKAARGQLSAMIFVMSTS